MPLKATTEYSAVEVIQVIKALHHDEQWETCGHSVDTDMLGDRQTGCMSGGASMLTDVRKSQHWDCGGHFNDARDLEEAAQERLEKVKAKKLVQEVRELKEERFEEVQTRARLNKRKDDMDFALSRHHQQLAAQ